MVETIAVPADDRFQVITEHPPGRLIYDRHYLDITRDDGIVLIQITLARGRPVEKKEALYRRIAEGLQEQAGIAPGNVFVSLVEVGREDWSFGEGIAHYAVADRAATGA